ncbi:PAS-domain containing protein [Rhizobium sp. C1]|uniref:PAS-domain containing protein n=1 Tax=Rhizobium sp. C1 TaxID=1349799 RepID=UPI001E4CC870|nr:PAS-domain containing protein [Rhizobium sp. C1]MCD2180380.1 PAS-domain containing protein [Rhizobium sp. C1]
MQQGVDLLAMACQRLARTRVPACIKDSELRYVAVSAAFAGLYRMEPHAFSGLRDADLSNAAANGLRDEMERKAIVFGNEAELDLAIGADDRVQRLKIEQFVSETGEIFLYEHVEPARPMLAAATAPWWVLEGDEPEAVVTLPTAEEENEPAFLSVLKNALSHIDAGILIIDPEDRVAFVNDKMEQIYLRYMGSIHRGETLTAILTRGIERGLDPDVDGADEGACKAWVRDRLEAYRQPYFETTTRLRTGRWIRLINRRLENGYVVGLRLDITDSKEREALLIRQRDEVSLYKAVLDALPVPVFVRDENHIMIYANEVERGLLETRKLNALGFDERSVFGEEADTYIEENDRVLMTGEVSVRETEMRHRADEGAHILSRISRAILPDGKPYIVGSLLDMSALRQRELELEDARNHAQAAWQQLSDIMNSIETGVLVIRQADLVVELANENLLRKWSGIGLDGLVGHCFLDMIDHSVERGLFDLTDEQREAAKENWRAMLTTGELPLREVTTAAGDTYVMQGQQIGGARAVVTFTNISQLRRQDRAVDEARAKLAETAALMDKALVSMAQGLLMISANGDVLVCNGAVERLLDMPSGMIRIGGRWDEIFAHCAARGDFGADPLTLLEQLREDTLNRRTSDISFCIGGVRWIRLEVKPTDDGGMIGLVTDVTELRRRQEELERLLHRAAKADRAKSDFLATVSREFRTPMNGVLSMTELLSRSDLDPRQKTYVSAISKSAKSLMTLINDILDFSKLDSGRLELHPVFFNPLEALEDTASILSAKAEEKNLVVVVSPGPDIPKRVFGDALRFRQIIFNLVSNAIRFTDRGHVEIRLATGPRVEGRRILTIEVEDTGCGIAPEHQRVIFESNARTSDNGAGRMEGLGIGLPTNVSLVRLFGGTIELESEIGCGSTFRVALPLECAETRAEDDDVFPAAGARVLLVDDIAVSRQSVGRMLAGWKFDATGVESVEEAWAVLEAADGAGINVDIVIVSGALERRGAGRLIERLRADPRFAATAVVLLTSVLTETLQGVAEIAVDAQLQRPVRSSLLLGALCDVIAARRRGAQADARVSVEAELEAVEISDDQPVDVLVAEDNEVNALVCRQILGSLGLSFRIARDGVEAVRLWQKHKPEIVIMDIMMPQIDGYEATAAIRAEEARDGLRRTPIIAITARTQDHDRNACLDADMDDYLPKPFTPELLAAKIDVWRSLVAGEAKITDDFIRSA